MSSNYPKEYKMQAELFRAGIIRLKPKDNHVVVVATEQAKKLTRKDFLIAKKTRPKRIVTSAPNKFLGQVEEEDDEPRFDDEYNVAYTKLVHLYEDTNNQDTLDLMESAENAMGARSYMYDWKDWLARVNKFLATQEPRPQPLSPPEVAKPKSKLLPPDAQNIQALSFNSNQFTCYGKPTGRGFRAYCRRK